MIQWKVGCRLDFAEKNDMIEVLFRRDGPGSRDSVGNRGERDGHRCCDYLCGISFLGLELCCLSTKPGFGFTPYFEKILIQEQEKKGIHVF